MRSPGSQQGSARGGGLAVQGAGFVRDSASEEPGGLSGPGTRPRDPVLRAVGSRQASGRLSGSHSLCAAGQLLNGAGDEAVEQLVDAGRRDSASEQPAALSALPGAPLPAEVCVFLLLWI